MNFIFFIIYSMYQWSFNLVDGRIHEIYMARSRSVDFRFSLTRNVLDMRPCIESQMTKGRYTKFLTDYHLAVPYKLTANGEFSTFHLPHFHDHSIKRFKERKKRTLDDSEMIHYGVSINGDQYHIELWPNRAFLHPNLVTEKRDPTVNIKDRYVRGLGGKKLCHYTGGIRGIPDSKAALSTCDGLAGYIVIGGKKYFIEPVDEHSPNAEGHHLHVVYDRHPRGSASRCGTKESWEDAMKKRFREQALEGKNIFLEKRGLESSYRYLEVSVICDKKFLHFHNSRDVELYVMTVMNMVSDFYHDSSVGNQMDVVVVRIIYLEKEEKEIDLEINRDSGKTLRSFCDWAIKINTPIYSPNHHDMALLFTRYDLCADAENDCDLTGLAFVGGACSKDEHCGINEDAGLVLSVITAHEIGHLMGAEHDEQATPCPVQDTDGSYFVMSPIVSPYTIRWSSCSRGMINALLDNNLGECLNDVPESTLYPYSDNMPGVVYDAEAQCKFVFPASLGVCGGLKEKICEQLVCKMSKTECMGKGEIPADGTKCGENKWCFRKECIEMGARPEAISGGWGDWGSWSSCSRTCGGGISYSERECNNPAPANKGRYCLGERRKIKICNTEPCPDDAPNFRQQQCSEHDSKPWGQEYHTWSASFEDDKPCTLYCINEKNVISQLESIVKDGTPCKPGTKNMCVSGACKVVGCDNVLDSDATEDHCGICNGDGTQCKIIEETYKDVGQGYSKVVVIPSGARKVVIEEKAPSTNMIAIADSSEKKFYLNKDFTEFQDGVQTFGKVEGIYSHPEPNMEKLVINGPLKQDLVLFVVFFEPTNVGYTYRWAEPSIDSTYEPRYHWETGEFGDCNVLCGGGTQTATIECMEEKAGKVSPNFCAGIDKPKDIVKNCNEQPCTKKWKVGVFGPCRACKNKSGVRVRQVECVEENPKRGTDDILIEETECEGPKPGTVELCTAEEKCNRKRMTSFIPGQFQEIIWSQMKKKRLKKEDKLFNTAVVYTEEYVSKSSSKPKAASSELNDHIQNDERSVEKDVSETSAKKRETSLELEEPTQNDETSTEQKVLETSLKTKVTSSELSGPLRKSTKYNIKGKIGKMVHDFRPMEEQVLYKYTIKSNPIRKNLSDRANAEMGDEIGDVIDTANKTVFTGKVAAKLKHHLEHSTNNTFNITCHGKKKDKKRYLDIVPST